MPELLGALYSTTLIDNWSAFSLTVSLSLTLSFSLSHSLSFSLSLSLSLTPPTHLNQKRISEGEKNLLEGAFNEAGRGSYWSWFLSSCASSMLSRIACGFRLALTNVNISVYLSVARGVSDVAVMRFSIPAIEICPPSDTNPGMGSGSGTAGSGSGISSSSHPTGKVVDNISYLLSKNVDIRGLTVTMSRKAAYIKPGDGINSNSVHTSSSSYEDRATESNQKSVGTIYMQSSTKKTANRAITPSDLCYNTLSPLTDVLLNPVHLILSAVVSAVPNTTTSWNQGSSSGANSKSKHKLDLGVELSNVEFSPTFEQLYLLSEAISSIKLEQIRCRLRYFRPRGMCVAGHARKWWKYAYEAVREIINEKRR
jgi:Vacuolar sorting-associated protein 13, N-terminal